MPMAYARNSRPSPGRHPPGAIAVPDVLDIVQAEYPLGKKGIMKVEG